MPIPLRADFDAQMVRAAAKRSKDGAQARRLLALAAIYEGATRTEAAKIGGLIRIPGDHFGLAIFGHQWKPAWLLIFSRSPARAAHRVAMI